MTSHVNATTTHRLAAAAMAGAATLAIAGFTALGSIFDYPKILKEPTAEILAQFREPRSTNSSSSSMLVRLTCTSYT